MLAIITTVDYSATAPIELDLADASQIKDAALRITRTATLDGLCSIDNMGFSHADRTLQLQTERCSEATAAALWALTQQAGAVCLAVGAEFFRGYLSRYRESGSTVSVSFLVERRLST